MKNPRQDVHVIVKYSVEPDPVHVRLDLHPIFEDRLDPEPYQDTATACY
jgi:hypothetical protein